MNANRFATYVDSVSQLAVREVKTTAIDDIFDQMESIWRQFNDNENAFGTNHSKNMMLKDYKKAQAELQSAMIRAALLRRSCLVMEIEVRE